MINGKINGIKSNNKVIIKKIDFLRKERSFNDGLYKLLETEICKKNKELTELIILTDKMKLMKK